MAARQRWGKALVPQGHLELAQWQHESAVHLAQSVSLRLVEAERGVLAASGRTEDARSLLHSAIENAQATGERFLLWRVHASLGRLFRIKGHPEAAEIEFSTVCALIDELAATIPDEGLKDGFLQGAYNILDVR